MSLHFVKDNVNIDFVGKRKLGFCLSGTLILLALLSMFFGRGLNLGIGRLAAGMRLGVDALLVAVPQHRRGLERSHRHPVRADPALRLVVRPELVGVAADAVGGEVRAALVEGRRGEAVCVAAARTINTS